MLKRTREFRSSKGKGRETSFIPSSDQDPAEPDIDLSLDERKLNYVNLSNGEKARTPTSVCCISLMRHYDWLRRLLIAGLF